MKFYSDIRLLILAIWLGAAVFFIGVAQSAFAVLPDRELAGAVVNRNLMILNFGGIGIAVILLLTSLVGTAKISTFWLWIERFLLLLLAATCAVNHFVITFWMSALRAQMAGYIDGIIPASDSPQAQFDKLHQYSTWVFMAGMVVALIAFFIISNRRFGLVKPEKADVYDFSKEFKV